MGLLDSLLGNAGEKDVADLQDEFAPLMAPGETLQRAFALMRDLIVFTDRRVLFVNKQGLTGSKVEYLSVPYRAIVMYSLETAGHFDMECDLKIWVSSQAVPLTHSLGRNSGAQAIIAILAQNTR